MSIYPIFKSDDYSDGRTKQSFKDDTDINKLLAKAAKGDAITHLAKHGAMYGDFTDMPDLLEAQTRLKRGQAIFDDLPAELRREFRQDAALFFAFVNDPANSGRLAEVIPGLAKPGNQAPAVVRTPQNMANVDDPEAPPVGGSTSPPSAGEPPEGA